ncbi:MAG TPA: SIMPL domain-containing protein [Chitinophagaceae bacterium]
MKRLMIVLFVLMSLGSFAQDNNKLPRTINVNGTAEMEIVPDEIYIQVELREYDRKGSGKVDIETIRNDFLAAAKSIGLSESDLSVQGYSGWDGNYWWWHKKNRKNPDMKAGITYWVKVNNTARMDELVKKLDDEATQNFFIAKVWHSKMTEFKKQLKIQAIKAAKEKAIYLAEAIGEHVGEAITINEPNEVGYYPGPMYRNKMANVAMESNMSGDSAAPMNVDFKKIKLQFDVNVVFALK